MAEEWYNGVEETDIGSLDNIIEQKILIPATRNVNMKITKAENFVNKDNTYRQINMQLRITKGIDEAGKYKNKVVFARVCYYADPTVYTKDFFKNKQHLVGLKQLVKATGIEFNGKVDGHFIDALANTNELRVDITIKKRVITIEGNEQELQENEVRNFKPIPMEELV